MGRQGAWLKPDLSLPPLGQRRTDPVPETCRYRRTLLAGRPGEWVEAGVPCPLPPGPVSPVRPMSEQTGPASLARLTALGQFRPADQRKIRQQQIWGPGPGLLWPGSSSCRSAGWQVKKRRPAGQNGPETWDWPLLRNRPALFPPVARASNGTPPSSRAAHRPIATGPTQPRPGQIMAGRHPAIRRAGRGLLDPGQAGPRSTPGSAPPASPGARRKQERKRVGAGEMAPQPPGRPATCVYKPLQAAPGMILPTSAVQARAWSKDPAARGPLPGC